MTRLIVVALPVAAVLAAFNTGCSTEDPKSYHFGRAHIFHLDDRGDKAETEYNEVITLDPKCAEVYFNKAQLAERQGNTETARKYYEEARRNYRQDQREKLGDTEMALGASWFSEGSTGYAQALDHFRKAADHMPNNPLAHYNIGIVLEAQSRLEDALKVHQRAVELKPDFGRAHLSMAFIYEDMGEIDKARAEHSLARQNGEDDPVIVERLTWWNEWSSDEITTRPQGKPGPKFEIQYPRNWRIGSAAQAGVTIARAFPNTAAIIIGERSSVQIVGPDDTAVFSLRGPESPTDYAATCLGRWLLGNIKEVYEQPAEGQTAVWSFAGEWTREVDEATGAEKMTPPASEPFSFANGSSGAMQKIRHVDGNGRTWELVVYFYLGEENSYVVVTTREESTERRIMHGLRYVTWYLNERQQAAGIR